MVMRRGIILLLLLLCTLGNFTYASVTYSISPDRGVIHLIPGSDVSNLGIIKYKSSFTYNESVDYCKVEATVSTPTRGLSASVENAFCNANGDLISVEVDVGLSGTYRGGDYSWYPLSSVMVALYKNGSVIGRIPLHIEPINFKEVKVGGVIFGSPPVDLNSVYYESEVSNQVLGTSIRFVPYGTANLQIELSERPDIPATLTFKYYINGKEYEKYVPVNDKLNEFTLPNVELLDNIPYNIYSGDTQLLTGTLPVENISNSLNIGYAYLYIGQPYLKWKGGALTRTYTLVGEGYVYDIRGGQLMITLTADGNQDTTTITTVGVFSQTLDLGEYSRTQSGYREFPNVTARYKVTFNPHIGTPTVAETEFHVTHDKTPRVIVSVVFNILFMLTVGAGFGLTVVGLLLRRPDMQTSGLILLSSAFLIFLIPLFMAYIIALLTRAGVPDPVGLSSLTIMNFGEKLGMAVEYIENSAMVCARNLLLVATLSFGILGTSLAGVITGGIFGWITGGALSQFLGKVLGTAGSLLVTIGILSLIGFAVVSALGKIYGILVSLTIAVLLFSAVLRAVYTTFTGHPAGFYGSIITLSSYLFTVLIAPSIVDALSYITFQNTDITLFCIPHTSHCVTLPTTPFTAFGVAIIKLLIIGLILRMSVEKLMQTLAQGG